MPFLILCFLFALFPSQILCGAKVGCELCINTVIPSLFPFMFASSCLINSRFAPVIGSAASKVLSVFKMSGVGCVCFIGGLIGGYGSGAVMVYEAYGKKQISKSEAETILAYANNAGPLFIICAVGIAGFHSVKTGVELYAIQALTAFICAVFFCRDNERERGSIAESFNEYKKNNPGFSAVVTQCAQSSVKAMANVCAFVVLFSAIIQIIPENTAVYVSGILEVTQGCRNIAVFGEKMLPLISSIISWGGLSVHFQANSLCKGQLSLKKYYCGKILSAMISFILTVLYYGDIYVSAAIVTVTAATAASIWLICSLVSKLLPQRGFRRRRHS